jgi:hypothetical protein
MGKLMLVMVISLMSLTSFGQSQEAQQLLLNWEKLKQFKKILQNMKEGYQILDKGYAAIKDISQGNFSLHKTFLDALLQVSPAVRKYKRVADIINYQLKIVKDYKAAFTAFKTNGEFTVEEIDHIGKVYQNVMDASFKNVDELSLVITAGKLRMSDDERLQAIDRIYASIEDQYSFLQEFNNNTAILALQRKAEKAQIELSKRINRIR